MKKIVILLCTINYLYASAPHAPTTTITANKQASAIGRDLLTANNIQNNTEVATETQVLTAVISIVAINGGNYGDVNIVQTAGSQSETIGTVGR